MTSDGPVKVTLIGCGAAREFGAGTTVLDLVGLPLL